ncbi:MAG: aminotransferase class I/II-fold pyridoxal phosphate-dependent enzyme, partial [Bacteroidales bacterium]|nr:aminotransferase class I/II-fold pyridoxal phosphate-dependent enzyme [Bacteroidales bacterium]
EYRVFIESMGASIQVVPASFPKLDLNLDAFENMINDKTVAVILNSPNNPTGVVYQRRELAARQGEPEDLRADVARLSARGTARRLRDQRRPLSHVDGAGVEGNPRSGLRPRIPDAPL